MADQQPVASETTVAHLPERRGLKKGVYLLPNLVTTGALFAGFYAIIAAMTGAFESACIAIVIAGFLDALDGRIARMTNTTSEFGVQYDSMSDLVAFGVAPAILLFSWALSGLGKIGWIVAFLYACCAAMRLARFNTAPDSKAFYGLASPAAAGTMATMVWTSGVSYSQRIRPGRAKYMRPRERRTGPPARKCISCAKSAERS